MECPIPREKIIANILLFSTVIIGIKVMLKYSIAKAEEIVNALARIQNKAMPLHPRKLNF